MNLAAKNMEIGYSMGNQLISEINFSIGKGLTGLIGPNGSGKSTLLKSISGLLPLLRGEIFLNHNKIIPSGDNDLSKLIGIVLTDRVEVQYLTVYALVASGRNPYTGITGKLSDKDLEVVSRYLKLCGADHFQNRFVNEISDGEKQRALIARVLAQETPIVILDEPTSFLDFKARYEIMQLLKKITYSENKIIIFSSHDLDLVLQLSDSCIVIDKNNKFVFGTTNEIIGLDIPNQLLKGSELNFDPVSRKLVQKINTEKY